MLGIYLICLVELLNFSFLLAAKTIFGAPQLANKYANVCQARGTACDKNIFFCQVKILTKFG